MVVSTRGKGSGLGYGSGSGDEAIGKRMRNFITSEITHGTLDETPMMFGTFKEGIMELLDDHLWAFCTEIVAS